MRERLLVKFPTSLLASSAGVRHVPFDQLGAAALFPFSIDQSVSERPQLGIGTGKWRTRDDHHRGIIVVRVRSLLLARAVCDCERARLNGSNLSQLTAIHARAVGWMDGQGRNSPQPQPPFVFLLEFCVGHAE